MPFTQHFFPFLREPTSTEHPPTFYRIPQIYMHIEVTSQPKKLPAVELSAHWICIVVKGKDWVVLPIDINIYRDNNTAKNCLAINFSILIMILVLKLP